MDGFIGEDASGNIAYYLYERNAQAECTQYAPCIIPVGALVADMAV